jgi:6-phosphogluconolactonase (cycloisomerase 2 family)
VRTAIRVTAAAALAVATTAAAAAIAATPAFASVSSPAATARADGDHAVFVQTDNTAVNRIVVYRRGADGTLSPAGSYATGGRGGILDGSVVDHTASQGSLGLDTQHGLLYSVNAGSNTISVFAVHGDRLVLRQVLGSGGTFPVSVTVHGDVVYVLNALNGGSVQGYRVLGTALVPLLGSHRALGLDPTATPQFTTTPGQVAFTPDGSQLVVTTKGNGNDIDVFGVGASGRLSATPAVNSEPGTVPFAISFDQFGHLVIAEAGTNAVSTFQLAGNGTVNLLNRVATGQAATCWVIPVGSFLFASNAGTPSESRIAVSANGQLSLLGNTSTGPGAVDAATAAGNGGRFLYVQTGGNGGVDEFSVASSGALTKIGAVIVPGAVGGEGIVAS